MLRGDIGLGSAKAIKEAAPQALKNKTEEKHRIIQEVSSNLRKKGTPEHKLAKATMEILNLPASAHKTVTRAIKKWTN